MLEYPECRVVAQQLGEKSVARTILEVHAAKTPHKFAFFSAMPEQFNTLLANRRIDCVDRFGAYVQFAMGHITLVLGDGVSVRWYAPHEEKPQEHQLYLGLDDGSAIVCNVGTYGGIWAQEGVSLNQYHRAAVQKPDILGEEFTMEHFIGLLEETSPSLSLKAALATDQRIPGLGNGVLQDILFNAQLHPQKTVGALKPKQVDALFFSIKATLSDMAAAGGRDTEQDIFGTPGQYHATLSCKTVGTSCPHCGQIIQKATYMGSSVYWCPGCQPT